MFVLRNQTNFYQQLSLSNISMLATSVLPTTTSATTFYSTLSSSLLTSTLLSWNGFNINTTNNYYSTYNNVSNSTNSFFNSTNVLNSSNLIEYQPSSISTTISTTSPPTTTLFNNVNFNFNSTMKFQPKEFIFDRTDVRIIFISLYSLVFCCCFFGNLLVILVVTLSRRLRSITNFFLANLAVADFCVGVFCVMQNLSIYLIPSWVFGEFLCKMYQFVHSLSYTASIFILVVICMERYFAIIHPIQCKQILTPRRLRLVIVGVWITSAIYSTPKFIFVRTIKNTFNDGSVELICISHRKLYNSKLFDLFNFGFLYLAPLLVMTILYSRIAVTLWKSSRVLNRQNTVPNLETNSSTPSLNSNQIFQRSINVNGKYEKPNVSIVEELSNGNESKPTVVAPWRANNYQRYGAPLTQVSHSSQNVLRARRGVIRMLMVVVLIFALCNLPFHARKLWQYWSNDYKGDSNFNALFTPLTFLVTYFNSGVNPLLYAFLSRNFRKGMRELLLCSLKKNKKSQHLRLPMQNHSLPTDSTHVGNQP